MGLPAELSNLANARSLSQWVEHGRKLHNLENAVPWAKGDWWNSFSYGSERREICEKEGWSYPALKQCGCVAKAFQLDARASNLEFSHYRFALRLPEKERVSWIDDLRKEAEPISAQSFRRQIKYYQAGISAGHKLEVAKTKKVASVLYVDPPWKYNNTGLEGAAEDHYPPMTVDELCLMDVPETTSDAALFLWVTNPLLPDGLKVMKAWGFEYKTNWVWIKDKPMNSLGFYNRGQHELLLLGTMGSFLPEGAIRALPTSIISAPKAEHSRKPKEAYEMIEKLYERFLPVMREGFQRGSTRKGWLPGFGNQAQ